jgi:hypothetical protein
MDQVTMMMMMQQPSSQPAAGVQASHACVGFAAFSCYISPGSSPGVILTCLTACMQVMHAGDHS